ncbi:patatin-like phospholipase domain-containing protein 4 [Erinaceus europaeus]|uniref:Patatin-like phospholipase domain-containing protein 4 n=1 Tax=Erinaceus europaeus TaxID=9365 RepID=A0ABM3WR92_ERIEU|nr:patatin-like phospholipase domain-containing protein 4 [Erinaceus europaeus]XP_060039092.1 patatin-like phospholipase domain-containing protein 4 [Erinaceus europaeus]
MPPINLSFSACGFLGVYHLGVAAALHTHGQKLLGDVQAFAGASAGSLVASVLLTAPQKIQDCYEFTCHLAEEARGQALGAATPGFDFMARLRSGVDSVLPPDAHLLAQHRLHVSITHTGTLRNRRVSCFSSRDDLIQVLLASSFVPVYAGLKPVEYQGQRWVDGGLTDSLPVLPDGRTVTVSPFCGRLDIAPRDGDPRPVHLRIARQEVALSLANLVRLNHALFPPGPGAMAALRQQGFRDAVCFLQREDWFQPRPDARTPDPRPGPRGHP